MRPQDQFDLCLLSGAYLYCVKRSPPEMWYTWQVQSNLEGKRSVLCDLMMGPCKDVIAVANSNVCSCTNRCDLSFSWADLLFLLQLVTFKRNNKQKWNTHQKISKPQHPKGQIKARILFTCGIRAALAKSELGSGSQKSSKSLQPCVMTVSEALLWQCAVSSFNVNLCRTS